MIVLVFLLYFFLSFAQECEVCDITCGDWSCITNCSSTNPPQNPTFNTYRCAVDGNNNNQIDDCSELLQCQAVGGKYVCPTDMGDSLCTSNEWTGPYPFDTNPEDFDATIVGYYVSVPTWGYQVYQQKLSQYSLSCPQPPRSSSDRLYQYAQSSTPLWVCGGAFYSDAWLSFDSCSYISYDGAAWKVKNNACSDPNKIWQKLGSKCYGTVWQHSVYVFSVGMYVNLTWNIPVPQGSFNQEQVVNVGGQNYRVRLRCMSSVNVVDESTGGTLNLCTTFHQEVFGPDNALLYTLTWNMDSSWSCPVQSLYGSSQYTYETLSSSYTFSFTGVILERQNNALLKGAGLDPQGRRCRICATSMQGISGGVVKEIDDNFQDKDFDKLAQCMNPRFFSGEARRCRPGGITTLGASCCGISGWTKGMCSRGEKELKKKRQAEVCTYVGDFCSKRVLGACVEKKRTYCCFYSRLARIFNECGRPQINRSWGSGKNPDCKGFTINEFSQVDFSDPRCVEELERWAMDMASRIGDRVGEDIANRAVGSIQNWINNMKNQKDYGGEK